MISSFFPIATGNKWLQLCNDFHSIQLPAFCYILGLCYLDRMGSSVVLIVSAGLLAFVVLYNLNNINITERQRELATLKVLGFFDGEVASYVYRENMVLTLFGVIAGMGIGTFLHHCVIQTVEVDMMMFGRNVFPRSYGWSALITLAFALFVNFMMFYRLRKIDMIESLKSVE